MKLNLKLTVKDIQGNEIEENGKKVILSEVIAARMFERSENLEPLKAYHWALKLYSEGELEVDQSDLNKLKDFIDKSPTFVLVKGLALDIINKFELELNKSK